MHRVSFIEPASLIEVSAALASPAATAIAGGSDLLDELKEGTAAYTQLVSLGGLDSLRSIEAYEGGLRIGALVTIWELETSAQLSGPYAMLAEAARGVATPELRNQGTLGGNLCQRPRCYFYRNHLTPCRKKGDADACPAAESPHQNYLSIFGGAGCHATHASDLAPPLIALGARIFIEGASGAREVQAEAFFTGPEVDVRRENVLQPGEVVTHVVLPPMPSGRRGAYSKARERTAGDFALASAAIGYELAGGRMTNVRVVLGAVAPSPFRSAAGEGVLEGQAPSEYLAERAATAALEGATPLAGNGFKVDLLRALVSRGVMRLSTGQ
jgi:xanthine dehydrogenase YagS FAD-binding subunit